MKETVYFEYFKEIYAYMARHYPPVDTEDYIDQLVTDGDALAKQYNSPFMTAMILAVMKELERKMIDDRKTESANKDRAASQRPANGDRDH